MQPKQFKIIWKRTYWLILIKLATKIPKMVFRYFYKFADFSFTNRKKIIALLDLVDHFVRETFFRKISFYYSHLKFVYRAFVFSL